MERNTVERDIKTGIVRRTEYRGVDKVGWFMSDINRSIPTTRRGARGDTGLYELIMFSATEVRHEVGLLLCSTCQL